MSIPGTVQPEETITLPRTCDLVATILDPTGKAYTEQVVYLRVVYEQGPEQSLALRTDQGGRLNEKDRVRATSFVLEVRSADSKTRWKSQRLDGSAGNALDLGEVVLGGEDD